MVNFDIPPDFPILGKGYYSRLSSNYIITFCPFCVSRGFTEDKSGHLHIHDLGWYRCMKCGQTGSVKDLGIKKPTLKFAPPPLKKENKKVPSPGRCIPIHYLSPHHQAFQHFKEDGFCAEEIVRLSKSGLISYCVKGWSLANQKASTSHRIIFWVPCYPFLGWQARWLPRSPHDVLPEGCPKYITSPNFPKSIYAYNTDRALLEPYVVIVEGIKKAWKVGKQAIATLGLPNMPPHGKLPPSDSWLHKVLSARKPIFILLDKGAEEHALSLEAYFQQMEIKAKAIFLPKEFPSDVGLCSREQIQTLLKPHIKFLFPNLHKKQQISPFFS